MSILFIPVAIPGSGKSVLAEHLPGRVVSTDAIRSTLGDVNDQNKNDQVFDLFHKTIGDWLRAGCDVFADATNLDARARAELVMIAQFHHAKTHAILFTNLLQALRRNRARDRKVPEDVMRRMLEKYEQAMRDMELESYDFVTEVSGTR